MKQVLCVIYDRIAEVYSPVQSYPTEGVAIRQLESLLEKVSGAQVGDFELYHVGFADDAEVSTRLGGPVLIGAFPKPVALKVASNE